MATCDSACESTNILQEKKSKIPNYCVKCSEPAVIIARIKDPMCLPCYDAYYVHRFRSSLGKSRLFLTQQDVFVAYSGGINSSSLLHMVHRGVSEVKHKKLQFQPYIVTIDESSLFGEYHDKYELIKNVMQLGFQLFWLPLEAYFAENYTSYMTVYNPDQMNSEWPILTADLSPYTEKMCAMFENITEFSEKQTLLDILRQKLLSRLAYNKVINKILTGHSASRLSIQLLQGLTIGRGSLVNSDVSFADLRYKNIYFCKPMREFLAKEIAFHSKLKAVPFFPKMSFNLQARMSNKSHSSIHNVTEDFLNGLQNLQPFTTNTVFRTGDKLSMNSSTNIVCSLCAISYGKDHGAEIGSDVFKNVNLCYSCGIIANNMKIQSVNMLPINLIK